MTVVGGLVVAATLAIAGCAAVAGASPDHGAAAGQRHAPVQARAAKAIPRAADLGAIGSAIGATGVGYHAGDLVGAIGAAGVWFPKLDTGSAKHGTSKDDTPDSSRVLGLASDGIPITALNAYEQAAVREGKVRPSCGLTWPLLAGIGRVESDHGRFAGAILHADGVSTPRIVGIPLNGNGTALIRDTDGGRLDGDTVYDRAVGPMQFIPSTWAGWGVDANHDGVKDPNNIFDAAAAAADYLCAAGRALHTYAAEVQAVRSYNNSDSYIALVLSLERVYAKGLGVTVPIEPANPDPKRTHPKHHPHLPPVNPGPPTGIGKKPVKGCPTAAAHRAGPSPTPTGSGAGTSCPKSGPSSGTSSPPAGHPSSSSSEPSTPESSSSSQSGSSSSSSGDSSTPPPPPTSSSSDPGLPSSADPGSTDAGTPGANDVSSNVATAADTTAGTDGTSNTPSSDAPSDAPTDVPPSS